MSSSYHYRQSKLARRFASAFPSPSKPLPEVLSHFSLPVSLGDIKEIIVNEVSVCLGFYFLYYIVFIAEDYSYRCFPASAQADSSGMSVCQLL